MADRSFLAWPFFDDRHRALADGVDAVVRGQTCRHDHERRRRGLPRAGAPLGRDGWRSLRRILSAELDVRSLCLARETLAYARRPRRLRLRDAGPRHRRRQPLRHRRATRALAPARRARRRDRGLRALRAGGRLRRRRARDEPRKRTATATSLDGEKTWISNGGIADPYVVFARTGEAPGAGPLRLPRRRATSPGFSDRRAAST